MVAYKSAHQNFLYRYHKYEQLLNYACLNNKGRYALEYIKSIKELIYESIKRQKSDSTILSFYAKTSICYLYVQKYELGLDFLNEWIVNHKIEYSYFYSVRVLEFILNIELGHYEIAKSKLAAIRRKGYRDSNKASYIPYIISFFQKILNLYSTQMHPFNRIKIFLNIKEEIEFKNLMQVKSDYTIACIINWFKSK